MNMLSNNALQQLDETGLYAPVGWVRPTVTQDAIDAGIREARLLRSRAFHRAVWKLLAMLNGTDDASR
ncbi:MAG: hypothetical protein RLN77_06030 [Rhodospirillales bacterium]|tara:strand:- start:3245 stop:3448 length:204 start_codon:yes stop_codon:yes gene_type:complete